MPAPQFVSAKCAIANVANKILRQFRRFDSFVQSALMITEHVGEGKGSAANIADVSLLVLEMLVESVTFETGMSSEAGAADFAIQRRFRVVNSGDVIPQLAVGSGAERAGVDEAVIRLHVDEGIPELDLLLANATRLKRRHLREDLRQTALPFQRFPFSFLLLRHRTPVSVSTYFVLPQSLSKGKGFSAQVANLVSR